MGIRSIRIEGEDADVQTTSTCWWRWSPDGAYDVEFVDDDGKTSAELALEPEQLLVLHHRPQLAS